MYSAKYRGEDIAVKVLNQQTLSGKVLNEFTQEVKTMNAIRSRLFCNTGSRCASFILTVYLRYIVSLFGACTADPHIAIVMELMEGGSLSELLATDGELPWSTRLLMAGDIARGIQVLHSSKPQVSISQIVETLNNYARFFIVT